MLEQAYCRHRAAFYSGQHARHRRRRLKLSLRAGGSESLRDLALGKRAVIIAQSHRAQTCRALLGGFFPLSSVLAFNCACPTEARQLAEGKHVVVVGGGWAGFGAAYALLSAGVNVTILDASKTPGGLSSGWRTPGGRSVEAGIKGCVQPRASLQQCNVRLSVIAIKQYTKVLRCKHAHTAFAAGSGGSIATSANW